MKASRIGPWSRGTLPPARIALKKEYKTFPLLIELPWFGRNAASMRNMGVKLIKALILMNTLKNNDWGEL